MESKRTRCLAGEIHATSGRRRRKCCRHLAILRPRATRGALGPERDGQTAECCVSGGTKVKRLGGTSYQGPVHCKQFRNVGKLHATQALEASISGRPSPLYITAHLLAAHASGLSSWLLDPLSSSLSSSSSLSWYVGDTEQARLVFVSPNEKMPSGCNIDQSAGPCARACPPYLPTAFSKAWRLALSMSERARLHACLPTRCVCTYRPKKEAGAPSITTVE